MEVFANRSVHRDAPLVPERVGPHQLGVLTEWLDAGLRRGEPGRLAREYPLSMSGTRGHRCIFDGEHPVAHAMMHPADLVARGRSMRIGMIGNVYTDPAWRRQGLASACVAACSHDAKQVGAVLGVLWSDAWDFYRPLGFHPAGRETLVSLADDVVASVEQTLRTPICVGPAFPNEWRALEELYAAKPERVERPRGALERLAAAPESVLRVARHEGQVTGYAVAGRGDDFRGVIHEWAGEADGVLACVADLYRSGDGEVVLSSPTHEPAVTRLLAAGTSHRNTTFALAQILDAGGLWNAVAPSDSRIRASQRADHVTFRLNGVAYEIDMEGALDLFFGRGVNAPAVQSWPDELLAQLGASLPHPLYVWGFDSI